MASVAAVDFQVLSNGDNSERSNRSRKFKAGIAVCAGSCLGLLSMVAISAYSDNTSMAESATNLFGITSSLRQPMPTVPQNIKALAAQLPGPSPWKELTLAGIQDANRCGRDISTNANTVKAVLASMTPQDKAVVQAMANEGVARVNAEGAAKAEEFLKAGAVAPLGFWDPLKLSANLDEGQLLFYREAELKHGRICMLATLGFVVAEKFHPLFGGDIDVPSALVGTTRLADIQKSFWLAAMAAVALPEVLAQQYVGSQFAEGDTSRVPGDLGFDPLGLKPKDPKALLEIQNKEILNGRLAMISIFGMMAEELVTKQKLTDHLR